jgi:hypothetical protein
VDNGELFFYEDSPYPLKVESTTFALGSGREFALVSLNEGHNAVDVVDKVSQVALSCGLGIDVFEVQHRPKPKKGKKK